MIQKIVDTKNPKLRIKSKPALRVDKKIVVLVKDLKETLIAQKDPEGIGLAAPQIGKNLRVFVMLQKGKVKTIINPKIIKIERVSKKSKPGHKRIMEGCLSLPNYYSPIERAPKLTLEYTDEVGVKKMEIFDGLDAQIVQHEIDHLDGILFIDRLLEQKKFLYEHLNGEWEKVDLPQ